MLDGLGVQIEKFPEQLNFSIVQKSIFQHCFITLGSIPHLRKRQTQQPTGAWNLIQISLYLHCA